MSFCLTHEFGWGTLYEVLQGSVPRENLTLNSERALKALLGEHPIELFGKKYSPLVAGIYRRIIETEELSENIFLDSEDEVGSWFEDSYPLRVSEGVNPSLVAIISYMPESNQTALLSLAKQAGVGERTIFANPSRIRSGWKNAAKEYLINLSEYLSEEMDQNRFMGMAEREMKMIGLTQWIYEGMIDLKQSRYG